MNNSSVKTSACMIGFSDEIAHIQVAIADFESGKKMNVAIIAEPYAGRTTLLNQIEKMNVHKVIRIDFSSVIRNRDDISLIDRSKRIVAIDDCQFLYMRHIGGFDILEDFLRMIVSSSNLFITTWNLYSWNYLDEVVNISNFFPVKIILPRLNSNEIRECILSRYKEDEIKFLEDIPSKKEKLFNTFKKPVKIGPLKRTWNFPAVKINLNLLRLKLSTKEEQLTTADMVFRRLHHLSNGNPGIAKVIWNSSLEYPNIKLSNLQGFPSGIDLDYNESFILSIILSMKFIGKDDLTAIAGPEFQIDPILYRLAKQGLISIDDKGCCTIRPEAVLSTVDFLKKKRLVR